MATQSLSHYSEKVAESSKLLEKKYVELDLIKPHTVKVVTPLERELARLKGYGNAGSEVVDQFYEGAQTKGTGGLAQRSHSVQP